MPRLSQIVAIEKGVKSETTSEVTLLHRKSQVVELLNGITRTYEKVDDAGDDLPGEESRVQVRHTEVLDELAASMTDLFDITATKDWANTQAKSNVVVDDNVILEDVPVTYLLFLEKQLVDIHTFISKLPTHDPSQEWTWDTSSNSYRTPGTRTKSTKKVPKAVVLYEATKEHPAQIREFSEDVLAGYWDTIKFSGALPETRKRELLDRVVALQKAVKFAREEANSLPVVDIKTGNEVFDYLFADSGS